MRKHVLVGTAAVFCIVAFAPAAAQASAPLTLQQRLLRPSEFKGFTASGQHRVIRSAGAWSGGYLPVADLRLHRFVAGVRFVSYVVSISVEGSYFGGKVMPAADFIAAAEAAGLIAKIESPLEGLSPPRRGRAKRDSKEPPAP